MRVYLTGKIAIEGPARTISESEFPGRQGRLLFAYLVCAEGRPVPRDRQARTTGWRPDRGVVQFAREVDQHASAWGP